MGMDRHSSTPIFPLFALLISLCIGFTATAFGAVPVNGTNEEKIRLPELGSPSDQYLTPADEARLGRAFMQSILETQPVLDDPLITEYIQTLGNRLLNKSEAAGQEYRFFVIEEPMINAFAGPGGHIGIYTGLILATQSESELASVIAHEIAHVTQKHLLRAFDAANRMSGKTAVLMLAAILVGIAGSTDAGIALASGVQAGALQEQINFTRSNEQEADHVGIKILADAELDPRSMPVFFERLTHANRLFDSGIPEMLRTHPVTTNRIADALGRAETYSYKQYSSNLRYFLTRETLRMRQFEKSDEAVKHFRSGLEEGRYLNKEAHQFGYALALAKDRNFPAANKLITELLIKRPDQVEYILAEANIAKESGGRQKALRSLETAHMLLPDSYPVTIAYSEILLEAGKAEEAKKTIDQARSFRPNDPRLFRLLAKAEENLNNNAQSHRLLSEAYVAEGKLSAAIQQLDIALKQKKTQDFYQASQIEARLRELKALKKLEDTKNKKK